LRLTYPAGPRFLFDDELVVYNPLSWDVHVLNAAAAAVYEFLLEAPASRAEVESLLAELLVENERSAAAEHAESVIGDLKSLGLLADDEPRADARC
jgi:PqqD family protein of HPr-rel-A system